MNAERLIALYEQVADAPDAISRLRQFILDLAVRGKLVAQQPSDQPLGNVLQRAGVDQVSNPDLPPTWCSAKIKALLNFRYGKALGPDARSDEGRVPVYGSNGVVGFTETPLTEVSAIVVGRKGSAGALHLCEGPSWTTDVAYFVEAPPFYELQFLLIALKALKLHGLGKGVKPGLSRGEIYELRLCLPPIAEQQRIVARFGELMALCDRLEAARADREAARDRLTSASIAYLTAADTEQSDALFALGSLSSLTHDVEQIKQIRKAILNLAVRGGLSVNGRWKEAPTKLGDVASLQNGYAFKSEWFSKQGHRLLRNANVGHSELNWAEEVRLPDALVSEFERFRLVEGDVVLSLDRPFIATGTKVARVAACDLPALLLQRVGRFVLTPALSPDYLFLWVNSPHFSEQIDPGRSNGVPHISSKQVEAAVMFLPPLAEQHRIVAKVDELMAICDQLEASLTAADATRSRLLESLLHEALNGDAMAEAA